MHSSPSGVLPSLSLAALLAMVTPFRAAAQSPEATIWTQLEVVKTSIAADGYSSRSYLISRLKDDESESWTVTLHAGTSYMIIGACDTDCQDVDMALLDSSNKEVDSDRLPDDTPVLIFTAPATGTYTIKIMMSVCNQAPCYFGVGLFLK